jgi:SecD/SecF fusion protein
LITALVLYAIGTDQIRGFAVTLILGILMSMYTAIFCSRVVFDIAERRHWIEKLKMLRIVGTTQLDFIGKRTIAAVCSVTLITIGLIAVGMRGQGIFDIDFTGGVSVTMVLQDSMPPDEVRSRLNQHFEDATPPIKCTVNTVSVDGRPNNSVYKIDADVSTVDELEKSIQATFRNDRGESLLLSYTMDFGDVKLEVAERPVSAPSSDASSKEPAEEAPPKALSDDESGKVPAEESSETSTEEPKKIPAKEPGKIPAKESNKVPAKDAGEAKAAPDSEAEAANKQTRNEGNGGAPKTEDQTSRRQDLPADNLLAVTGPFALAAQEKAANKKAGEKEGAEATSQPETKSEPPTKSDEPPKTVAEAKPSADSKPPAQAKPPEAGDTPPTTQPETTTVTEPEVRTMARLTFGDEINAPTLREKIQVAYTELRTGATISETSGASLLEVPGLFVDPDEIFDWDQESAASSTEWYVRMVATQDEAEAVLQRMKQDLAETPVFPSSSKIGGKVAGDTRNLAIAALVASLFGIVGYIWIRFQRVVFGVAAVIALVHDVLITLGAIALSAYLTGGLGFLLVDEFKISLPIVAAFLTIIGYSLNDTIVVFDRIREVRGKSPDLTAEMINTSINQTLSRTLLTSLTTLLVVVILYALGGQGIHGFAFALVIGVLVGTYSSMFIASPALLWMFNRGGVTD